MPEFFVIESNAASDFYNYLSLRLYGGRIVLSETNTQKLEEKPQESKGGFLELCDEFSEYNDYCAFFCESISLHAMSGKPMDKVSAQGLERFARAIRGKSQYFNDWLQELHVGI